MSAISSFPSKSSESSSSTRNREQGRLAQPKEQHLKALPPTMSSLSVTSALSSNSAESTETVVAPSVDGSTHASRPMVKRSYTSPVGEPSGSGTRNAYDLPFDFQADEIEEEEHEEFVVAMHDFTSPNATCLSFRAGDVIRVFNRDASGWWDGDLGGERGWFPSNYVDDGPLPESDEVEAEAALQASSTAATPSSVGALLAEPGLAMQRSLSAGDAEPQNRLNVPSSLVVVTPSTGSAVAPRALAQPGNQAGDVLEPIRHSISLLQNAVRAGRRAHFQPATACVISSVRSVLSATDCLTRESTTLRTHTILAKERKQVLSELSRLVSHSRRASTLSTNDRAVSSEMQDMLHHASNVLANTDRFLSVAAECGVALPSPRSSAEETVHGREATERSELDPTPTPGSIRSSYLTALTSATAEGCNNAQDATQATTTAHHRAVADGFNSASAGDSPWTSQNDSDSADVSSDPDSSSVDGVDTSTSADGKQATRNVTHTREQALDKLKWAHDHLLSIVAAVVGHAHTHTRDSHASSYAFLIDVTREAVDSVRNLLIVIEAVCANETLHNEQVREVSMLDDAKGSLYEATSALVTAARIVTSKPAESSQAASLVGALSATPTDEEERARLLSAATRLLRAGQECVSAAKGCLSKAQADVKLVMSTSTRGHSALPTETEVDNDGEESVSDREPSESSVLSPDTLKPADRRAHHTLASLERKATSLGCLRQRWELAEELAGQLSNESQLSNKGTEGRHSLYNHKQRPSLPHHSATEPLPGKYSAMLNQDMSGDTSDHSDAMSRQHSRASGSTLHSHQSSRTDLTSDPGDVSTSMGGKGLLTLQPLDRSIDASNAIGRADDTELPSALDKDQQEFADKLSSPELSGSAFEGLLHSRLLTPTYEATDICHNADGQVTGATLPALIEKLTPHDTTAEASMMNAFLVCFRLFTTPMDLYTALLQRYHLSPPPEIEVSSEAMNRWFSSKMMPIRLRVLNFFKCWLEAHWQSSTDHVTLGPLITFMEGSATKTLSSSRTLLLDLARRRQVNGDAKRTVFQMESNRGPGSLKRVTSTERLKLTGGLVGLDSMYLPSAFVVGKAFGAASAPPPIVSKSLLATLRTAATPNVLQIDALELARQLTVMESKVFCCILPEELLSRESSKSVVHSAAVNVKKMSAMTTQLTGWITESILGEEEVKKRSQMLKYFIKLADRCLGIKNYNAFFAIQGALSASTISRLRRTWDCLPTKYHNLMEQQQQIIDPTRNFAAYRSHMRNARAPALPFVGLCLTDLTFCGEGNADTRPSPLKPSKQLINFDKYLKMSRIVAELQRFQAPFTLVEVPEIQAFLTTSVLAPKPVEQALNPEDLYKRSLYLEPRQPSVTSVALAAASSSGAGYGGASGGMSSLEFFNWK